MSTRCWQASSSRVRSSGWSGSAMRRKLARTSLRAALRDRGIELEDVDVDVRWKRS
jgi:hypothetical protein